YFTRINFFHSLTNCTTWRNTMLPAGVGYGTIDLNVKMCRPLPQNQVLIATGKVINLSKNLGISEGKITDEEGKLYAYATATCMIIRP
ncbi:PaaI family thioesterase, partial [Acinetobacter baumannii]